MEIISPKREKNQRAEEIKKKKPYKNLVQTEKRKTSYYSYETNVTKDDEDFKIQNR